MDTENVQPQAGAQTPAVAAPDAPQPAPNKPAASAAPAQAAEDMTALPEWAQSVIKELRNENAKHRKAKTEAERQAAEAGERAAKEQGRWQELYQQAEPKAKRTDELEAFVSELLEAETAAVPDKLKPLIPQGDALTTLRWVQQAKAAGILAAPQAPRTDAGAASGGAVQPQKGLLTDERRQEIAVKYGLRYQDVPQQIGR